MAAGAGNWLIAVVAKGIAQEHNGQNAKRKSPEAPRNYQQHDEQGEHGLLTPSQVRHECLWSFSTHLRDLAVYRPFAS